MSHLSLSTILSHDPDYAERLKEISEDFKIRQQKMMLLAEEINRENSDQIQSHAPKHYQEGQGFLPAKQTPILNMLYFLLEDKNIPDFENWRLDTLREMGHSTDDVFTEDEMNQKYGSLSHDENVNDNTEELPHMETFIYENLTLDQVERVKKLKALSMSSNENEAMLAYVAGKAMCKKYNLDFDRIPCNVECSDEE
jgi:hypothetical protein